LKQQKRKLPSARTRRNLPAGRRHLPVRQTKHNKVMSKKVYIFGGVIIATLVLIFGLFLLIGNIRKNKNNIVEASLDTSVETFADLNDSEELSELTLLEGFVIEFGDIHINGTSQAIIYAKLLSERTCQDKFSFKVFDNNKDIVFEGQTSVLADGLYIKAEGLLPETTYLVQATNSCEGEILIAEETLEFTTPKRKISLKEVEGMIEDTSPRNTSNMSEENKILFQSHALMEILSMDFDLYERMEALTQVNQIMIDYSLNSYNDFVFWNNINETPTKESLALLKDIFSVNPGIKKEDIIKDFVISPYSMTKYLKYDAHGGQISSEDYIFDMMREDQNGQVYFVEYPYIVDTPEFQNKYADLINEDLAEDSDELKALKTEFGAETFDLPKDDMLQGIAAKNKVFFATYCAWWLEEMAHLNEKRIYLYSESGRHSMDSLLAPAMVAYSYMYNEYRQKTGKDLTVNNSYRSCNIQWDKYTKYYGQDKVLTWSGEWHEQRQKVSYVPGYSNHQFAVSIDFQPAQYAFIRSPEYDYLEKYAKRYGFYNYALEPWHWTYLGASIGQDKIDATPLATPLPEE
jgi:hypothetical protein